MFFSSHDQMLPTSSWSQNYTEKWDLADGLEMLQNSCLACRKEWIFEAKTFVCRYLFPRTNFLQPLSEMDFQSLGPMMG